MKIEELKGDGEAPDNCPKCNQELTLVYDRDDYDDYNPFSLRVFKCQKCHKFFSYWEGSYEGYSEPFVEECYLRAKNGKLKVSNESAAAYSKTISNIENRTKELNHLFQAKLAELLKTGLSIETLNLARSQAAGYAVKRSISKKGIAKILAATIYIRANEESTFGLWAHRGEGISEEQLEKIFGCTRKTIRKWKKRFENPF